VSSTRQALSHANLPVALDALLQVPLLQEIDDSDIPESASDDLKNDQHHVQLA
jgi:hypothetical protein